MYLVSLHPFFASLVIAVLVRTRFVDAWLSTLSTGGDDGNRTHDPLLAGQVLSQLSYTPILGFLEQSLKIEQQ